MAHVQVRSTRRQYPLLYWVTLVYIIGLPNFVHFDPTGRTHNPVNFSSISSIVLALITGYLLVVMLLLDRRPIICRRIKVSGGLWLALVVLFTFATVLQPEIHGTPASRMDLLLSFFRLGQWTLAFILFIALYSRTPPRLATGVMVELVGRACWVAIGLVWIFLPIIPQQVLGVSEDNPDAVRRLGGEFIGPGPLAVIAGIGFFYALFFFPRGLRKWAACSLAFVTLVLTSSRIGLAGFVASLVLYAIVYSRKPVLRWGVTGTLVLAGVLGLAFSNKLMKYVARGQSLQTLSSLDDRTRIWQAGLEAVRLRPMLGYGYSVGAKYALRDHWKYAHWTPPHAHCEFIQAALDGGVVAAGLTFCIYVLALWRGVRQANGGIYQVFLLLAIIQLELNGVLGGLMMVSFGSLGSMFPLCYIALAGSAAGSSKKDLTQARTRRPATDTPMEVTAV